MNGASAADSPTSYLLDRSTALRRETEDSVSLAIDPAFWNMHSAFGGWVAAIGVAAIEADARYRGELVTQNVQFHSAVRGERLLVTRQLVERRRTIDFWKVNIATPEAPSRILAAATMVAGERVRTQTRFDAPPVEMPEQQKSVQLKRGETTPAWLDHFEIFLAKGRPFSVNPTPDSATWVRESDGRPIDAKAMVAIADTPMPRTFFASDHALFASTIALSTHIYASNDELAQVGNDFVLLDSRCKTIRDSFLNQETYLYSDAGVLLAASYQTGLFREGNGDDTA